MLQMSPTRGGGRGDNGGRSLSSIFRGEAAACAHTRIGETTRVEHSRTAARSRAHLLGNRGWTKIRQAVASRDGARQFKGLSRLSHRYQTECHIKLLLVQAARLVGIRELPNLQASERTSTRATVWTCNGLRGPRDGLAPSARDLVRVVAAQHADTQWNNSHRR